MLLANAHTRCRTDYLEPLLPPYASGPRMLAHFEALCATDMPLEYFT